MKTTTKFFTMAAAVALLSAPALAGTPKKNVDLNNDGKADVYMKAMPKEGNLFKALDSNGNGRITQEEFMANTIHDNESEIFAMYDTDQNGYISKAELKNNSKFGGQKVPSNKPTTTNLKSKSGASVGSLDEKHYNHQTAYNQRTGIYVDNPFYDDPEFRNDVNIDIDNPFVDDPELKNDVNWDWPDELTFEPLVDPKKPLFAQLDTNRNGYITQKEFMKNTIHDNEAEMFARLDVNNDKHITRAELQSQMKTSQRKVND